MGELIRGTDGDDTLVGTPRDDTIFGGDGDDLIKGGDGDNLLKGEGGNDTIIAGEGNDLIYGGDGDDLIVGGGGNDTIFGGEGNDTIFGGDGDDLIKGGDGNDILKGEAGNDTIYGGAGNDTIYGGDGDDVIHGGSGNNKLYGGDGDDKFFATPGDTVYGDDGFDTLVLEGQEGNISNITITNSVLNPDGSTSRDGYVDFADGSPRIEFVSIEKIIPCFTPGTSIATPEGARLVETLREGDKIITRDNGIQEIRWAGSRVMDWKGMSANPHLKPILIEKGALGNGLPERDMMVSPQHRVLVANERTSLYFDEHEVLVAAKHLLNHKGVREVDSLGVTYVHFMCDRHEVVLSNGAWTETFQPGDYTLKGMGNAQRLELFELFPGLKTEEGRESYGAARKTLKRHEARLLAS